MNRHSNSHHRIQVGDTITDLAPEAMYSWEGDGCRHAATCFECPLPDCKWDAVRDERKPTSDGKE